MKRVLSIAGSDSGGGAGIQADLKAFAACGVYGTTAITALTAQNTLGVRGVMEVSPDFLALQIDAVMEDIGADAWKTGMLSSAPLIEVVRDRALRYGIEVLVVDPVMVAKGGDPLLRPEAVSALVEMLFPLAYVITPNAHEAQALIRKPVRTLEDAREAARLLWSMGPRNVIVKGGHISEDEAIDVLFDGSSFFEVSSPRVHTANTHGTGCTFASALAAFLARGFALRDAFVMAKDYVGKAIEAGSRLDIGRGHGPLDHFFMLRQGEASA